MRNRFIYSLGLLLLLCSPKALGEARQILFVDRSGSMQPYYSDGFVDKVGTILVETLKSRGETAFAAFSTDVRILGSLAALKQVPFGNSTLLDKPIEYCAGGNFGIAWMITDNIQDPPGAPEAGNTEIFYQKLRSPNVKRVTVFPLRQPAGRPGLMVYAILFDEKAIEQYEGGLYGFKQRGGGILRTDALRMKPWDKETIEVSYKDIPVNPRTKMVTYGTGTPVREQMKIRFKSKFDHIEIADSSIKVLKAQPDFDSASLIKMEKREIDINPRRVKSLKAGDVTEQTYEVDVDLGKLSLKKDLASIWKAAFDKNNEVAKLNLVFLIEVPQSNFVLRKGFIDEFHAASLKEATATGKVYALDRLPRLMGEETTTIHVSHPVDFRVNYPAWPAFVMIFIFFIIASIGIAIFVLAKKGIGGFERARNWQVEGTTDRGVPQEAKVEKGEVIIQGDLAGRIEKNSFLPGRGMRLENGAAAVRLSPGLIVKVLSSRKNIILKFVEKAGTPQPPARGAAPAPQPTLRKR